MNRYINDAIIQQEVYDYNKTTFEYEFPITALSFLIELFSPYTDVTFTRYEEVPLGTKNCDGVEFKLTPFEYQREAINYGLNKGGWMLLDDQGLGKTLQMIYLAKTLKETEGLEHVLIICGINGLKYNWKKEIESISDLSCTILGHTVTKTGKSKSKPLKDRVAEIANGIEEFFVITNMETLLADGFATAVNKGKTKFGMIIVDEAHKLKSPGKKMAHTLLNLKSPRNIALTGTLIMSRPNNAYVPLKWTGATKCTHDTFCKMYLVYGGYNNVQIVGSKNLDLLREKIDKNSLRRLKADVLPQLPERTFIRDYVEMGAVQQALYNDAEQNILAELDKLGKISILQEITLNMRLRQITAYPGMLSSKDVPSAKLDRLEDLVEQIVAQGDKVVVFSNFVETVAEVSRRLADYGVLECIGGMEDAFIEHNKQLFINDPTKNVMICTWQKMGTGHTLTSANYIIFIDTPWTPAEFNQCADRVHRIGQSKKATIITLVTKDTYDERVAELVDKKEEISKQLIDN